ncbi:hypothetical protein HAD_13064 [Hyphomonas adhaerens MHS-3]|uniref:Phospholipase D-like domain-containing protein n=2 Tax=Hyphomonas adhaerens TaxID=81029 RepID=A0A069E1W6_9PROT|nr:hypothetical protein HAD_13064 [Hyphomonas adhaerens MHS-3]
MPVKVGGAFHPKLIFLTGKDKGLVLVGSHNMTLSGFGFNREMTNLVRIDGRADAEGVSLAQDVWAEIEYWLSHFTSDVPDQIRLMVRRVREFAPWMQSAARKDGRVRLLAGRPNSASLWSQFANSIGGDVDSVSLTGAFFDRELNFVRQVANDLRPKRLTIAVDPNTVQISPNARTLIDISLVSAKALGVDEESDLESSRYLHAKGIFVQQEDGQAIFASGSANPSAPAWLSPNLRSNVELMLAYYGDQAHSAAEATGFASIAGMPFLCEEDWLAIRENAETQTEAEPPSHRSGVAVVEDFRVLLDRNLLSELLEPKFILFSPEGITLGQSTQPRPQDELVIVEFPEADLLAASALNVVVDDRLVLKLLLHHCKEVEEQSRSGTQRRFKEALQSLESDSPNIEALIGCIEKIVFSEATEAKSVASVKASASGNTSEDGLTEPGGLAIDVEEMTGRRPKKRLNHNGDFGYLLDTLIYHLNLNRSAPTEHVDLMGRSEEEQVGADDDQDEESYVSRKQEEILTACHAKVKTLIYRMTAQLKAFVKGEQPLEQVLVRLLAVLAVLRELRKCDGRVTWVEKGKTTVPEEVRSKLLNEIMFSLFEGEQSLLHLEGLGEEIQSSDDVARLKGLLLWLAWDCRLAMDLRKQFNESQESLNSRLERNAMVLALAQMAHSEDVVLEEAEESIGGFSSSDKSWLRNIDSLSQWCLAVRKNSSKNTWPEGAEPGDVALSRNIKSWDLRIVATSTPSRLSLIKLSKDNTSLRFKPTHLDIARLI